MQAAEARVFRPGVTGLIDLDGHVNFSGLYECRGNDRLCVDFLEWHHGG